MKTEIINVGTEILLGNILNTNQRFLSRRLAECGADVYFVDCVGDNYGRFSDVLRLALSRSDVVITTSGLGPTDDDITREVVADVLEKELVYNEESAERIKEYFEKKKKYMPERNLKQAYFPTGSIILVNHMGTADGAIVEANGKTVIMLPGPPRELEPMFDRCVVPYLKSLTGAVIVSHTVNVFGIGESHINELLCEIIDNANPTVAPYAKLGETEIRVSAKDSDFESAERLCYDMISTIKEILGDYVYGVDSKGLAYEAVDLLRKNKRTVACAESCTGGLLAKCITDVAGASEIFSYGLVTYSEESKQVMLGVSSETIERYGVVSEQVASEMAIGAMKLANSDFAVGITGYAGPDGGDENNPTGTVFVALAAKDAVICNKLCLAQSFCNREYVRTLSVQNALCMLINILREE